MGRLRKDRRSAAEDSFQERERKLNARTARQLETVRRYLISDPHYVTVNDGEFCHALLKGRELLGPPQVYTPVRIRVYYDDASLHGFKNGVEIRVEQRRTGADTAWRYKQVIKIGHNKAHKDGTFDRAEFPARLKHGKPDLDALGPEQKKLLKKAFNVERLSDIKLRPLIVIVSQRWRLEYHPQGDARARVEYAHDIARAQTCTGYTWDLFQAELELKKGPASVLATEERRLKRRFNFLSGEECSKPYAGFSVLEDQLAASPKLRRFVKMKLKPGAFRVFDPKSLTFKPALS